MYASLLSPAGKVRLDMNIQKKMFFLILLSSYFITGSRFRIQRHFVDMEEQHEAFLFVGSINVGHCVYLGRDILWLLLGSCCGELTACIDVKEFHSVFST